MELNKEEYFLFKIPFEESDKPRGDWGLGIGDWGLGPIPNPQSPIPNPHTYLNKFLISKN
jgi:hypothetical protein